MRNEVIAEAIGGYFGIYGIGRIMSGRVMEGLGLMFGYWVSMMLFIIFFYISFIMTLGLSLCVLAPLVTVVYLSLPIYSAYRLNEEIQAKEKENEKWLGIKKKK